jgi:hypothetical protein
MRLSTLYSFLYNICIKLDADTYKSSLRVLLSHTVRSPLIQPESALRPLPINALALDGFGTLILLHPPGPQFTAPGGTLIADHSLAAAHTTRQRGVHGIAIS